MMPETVSNPNWLAVVTVILGIINILVIPSVRMVWKYNIATRKKIDDFKLEVAKDYLTKVDINKRFDKIDESLNKIWNKLDKIKR